MSIYIVCQSIILFLFFFAICMAWYFVLNFLMSHKFVSTPSMLLFLSLCKSLWVCHPQPNVHFISVYADLKEKQAKNLFVSLKLWGIAVYIVLLIIFTSTYRFMQYTILFCQFIKTAISLNLFLFWFYNL